MLVMLLASLLVILEMFDEVRNNMVLAGMQGVYINKDWAECGNWPKKQLGCGRMYSVAFIFGYRR